MENVNKEKEDKLKDLAKLTGESLEETKKEPKQKTQKKINEPSLIDGYRFVNNIDLPFEGKLYPLSWKFFYRCPDVSEVANFSTVADEDTAKQVTTIEALIKKCWKIIDADTQAPISTSEINDGEKLFFFMKLREFYLHDSPIQYNVFNSEHLKSVTIDLKAENLVYKALKQSLLDKFDGRLVTIAVPKSETNQEIKFLVPTLEISRKITLYMQKAQKNIREKTVTDKDNIDKNFILFLPYLFESGKEKMEQLETKLKVIMRDRVLFDRYLEIMAKLSFTNQEKIEYNFEEGVHQASLEFPSFKRMFIIDSRSNNEDDI